MSMQIFRPNINERVVWDPIHQKLFYQRILDNDWKEIACRTLSYFPTSQKTLRRELNDFYNYCSEDYYY